jgi:hypothetical protein
MALSSSTVSVEFIMPMSLSIIQNRQASGPRFIPAPNPCIAADAYPVKLIPRKMADKHVSNDYLVRNNCRVECLRLNRD